MNQTITKYAKSSYNDEGREVVGSGSTVQCRFQKRTSRRLLPNNTVITIDAIVYVPPATSINTDDKVTFESQNYKVFAIYEAVGGDGQKNHLKCELIKWQTT